MKNNLKLSLWLLLTAITVPTHIATAAPTATAKKAEFNQQVRGFRQARKLYLEKKKAGLSERQLEPYKQQMIKTRRRAIALYGAAAFAAAIVTTVGAYAIHKKGQKTQGEEPTAEPTFPRKSPTRYFGTIGFRQVMQLLNQGLPVIGPVTIELKKGEKIVTTTTSMEGPGTVQSEYEQVLIDGKVIEAVGPAKQ